MNLQLSVCTLITDSRSCAASRSKSIIRQRMRNGREEKSPAFLVIKFGTRVSLVFLESLNNVLKVAYGV